MAHIEHSVKLQGTGLVLSKNDCKRLSPIIHKALKKEEALADKYRDIMELGDATNLQTTLKMKHEDAASHLAAILDELDYML